MSYLTSAKQQYTEPRYPYWIIWVVIVILSLIALGVCGQTWNYNLIRQSADGDTVCCVAGSPSGAFLNPVAVPGAINTYFLDATRPDIAQAFITSIGTADGAFVKGDWVRPDGLTQPTFTVILCEPEQIQEPCYRDINYPVNFTVNFADNFSQLDINWTRGNPYVVVVGCNGLKCRKLQYVTLSNDTRVNFTGEYKFFQIWFDRCNYTTLIF